MHLHDGTMVHTCIPIALSTGRTLLSLGGAPTESERRTQEEVCHIYVFIQWYLCISIMVYIYTYGPLRWADAAQSGRRDRERAPHPGGGL